MKITQRILPALRSWFVPLAATSRSILLLTTNLILFAHAISAQQPSPTTLPESGLVQRDIPQPLRFFDITGRKSALFKRIFRAYVSWSGVNI